MQQRIQLYIERQDSTLSEPYDLVDMFGNETIQLTSTIQNVRDIGRVFTDFTQSFTVPATPQNNKIFRHFYNYHITNSYFTNTSNKAYDIRKKKEAYIYINYAPFREGKIHLNAVKMKNNKAYAYELIFYGKTVELKDLIGDDELRDLPYLQNYNHDFSNTNVKNGLTSGLDFTVDNTSTGAASTNASTSQTDAIIYPLITSKKRLFYNSDSTGTAATNFTGNLYVNNDSGNVNLNRGLTINDLKPAIKIKHIIEAIESKYSQITFTRDFFADSNAAFSNLYLWINSKKGELNDIDDDEGYIFTKIFTGYSPASSDLVAVSGSTFTLDTVVQQSAKLTATFTVNDTNVPYDIIVRNTVSGEESVLSTKGNQSGTSIFLKAGSGTNAIGTSLSLQVEVKSKTELTISSITIQTELIPLTFFGGIQQPNNTQNYTISSSLTTSFEVLLEQNLPQMGVLDFLTGLFKMFNLVAYYIDKVPRSDANYGKIYVDTLDNYYADATNNKLGKTIDITRYIDSTEHTVESVLPFTDIHFKYTENDTILMEHHFEQFGKVFGDAEFNVRENHRDEIDRGRKYDIDIPFAHFKYERILDTGAAATKTDIQWGYSAGGDFETDTSVTPNIGDYDSVLTAPLIFYGIQETTSNAIAFLPSGANAESITQYFRPSNTNEAGSTTTAPSFSLNFDGETDEWNGVSFGRPPVGSTATTFDPSLYNDFYKKYVESVFNPAKRLFKIKALLPPKILISLKLNHQIKFHQRMFRINSVTTNLMTGQSELELLNIFSNEVI